MTMTSITAPFVFPRNEWGPLTAGKPYSLQTDGDRKFRFETRNNERYASPEYTDPPNCIRSEVYGPEFPVNTLVQLAYILTVDPGPVTTNCWTIFGQIHGDNDLKVSPLMSMNLQPDGKGGETLFVNRNYDVGQGMRYEMLAGIPFKRAKAMRIRILCRDSRGGAGGVLIVYADGQLVKDFRGAIGMAQAKNPSYPKFGIYAGGKGGSSDALSDPQTIVATYDNPTFMLV